MAYDTLSPYAGAYPQTQEEIPTSEATGKAMRQAGRDLGVGSLRFGTWMAMLPELDWLANRFSSSIGHPLLMADRLEAGDFDTLGEKESSYNLYLASRGLRGDKQHQEWAKGQFNKYHDIGFWAWAEQTPEVIDKIVPFESTLGSKAVEDTLMLAALGWGVYGITRLLQLGVTKGVPWLRNKIRSIVKNKQSEEILDDIVPKDIVPEASLQIEHKPVSEARIDKTVERTMEGAGEVPLLPSVRTGYMPSTSGYASPKTKMYHGAKGELPEEFMGFEDYASYTDSAYGSGFYTTSRTGTAKGYAGKEGKLYEVTPKKELKLFDMDQPVPPSIKQYIKRGGTTKFEDLDPMVQKALMEYGDDYFVNVEDFLKDNPKASLAELYDEMRALAPYENISASEVDDYFHGFASILQESGYKGLRHKGGVLSSRPKKHEVNIYWNPGKDLNIKPVAKADLAAGEKTVEIATAGEKVKPKPAKTKPKTMEEVSQKWQQKVTEAQSKYNQELRAITAANQTNPEKLAAEIKALDKRTEKIGAEMKREMEKDFNYVEEQAEIGYAGSRKKLEDTKKDFFDDLFDEKLLKTTPEHFQGLSQGLLAERTKQLARQTEKKIAQHTKQRDTEIDELTKEHKTAVNKLKEEHFLAMDKAKGGEWTEELLAVDAEYRARLDRMWDRNKVEMDETHAYFQRQWEAIEEMYYSEIEKIEDAFAILKEEEAVLPTGKITRHSRGGLVENKVNYALTQWK